MRTTHVVGGKYCGMYTLCRRLLPKWLVCRANFKPCSHEVNLIHERCFTVGAGSYGDYPDNAPRQTQLARYATKFHKPGDRNHATMIQAWHAWRPESCHYDSGMEKCSVVQMTVCSAKQKAHACKSSSWLCSQQW